MPERERGREGREICHCYAKSTNLSSSLCVPASCGASHGRTNAPRRANISSINFAADDFKAIFSTCRFRNGPHRYKQRERARKRERVVPAERRIYFSGQNRKMASPGICLVTPKFSAHADFTVSIKLREQISAFVLRR